MTRTSRWSALSSQPELNVAVFAFLLNYPWEFSQVPLFAGMEEAPHWTAIKRCAMATLGDIVIMLIAFWVVAAIGRSRQWIAKPKRGQILVFVALGVMITVVIESLALRGLWFDGWSYSPLMPLVPGLGIGLSPLLQWIILPILLVWFVRRQFAGAQGLHSN